MKKFKNLKSKIKKTLEKTGLSLNKNDSKLIELKNKHKGEKCVIIAMGPSLKLDDLNKFSSYTTLACNKIFLAMEETGFKPNYYFISDSVVAENNKDIIPKKINSKTIKIFSQNCKSQLNHIKDAIYYAWDEFFDIKIPFFKQEITGGLYGGGYTVTFDMVQFAVYMGFKEIISLVWISVFMSPKVALRTNFLNQDKLLFPKVKLTTFIKIIESLGKNGLYQR